MFDSLKKKLQNIKTKFTSRIEEVAGPEPAAIEQPALPEAAKPVQPPAQSSPEPTAPAESVPEEKGGTYTFNRLKVLVTNGGPYPGEGSRIS